MLFVPDFSISNIIANIAEQDKEVEGISHKHFFYINPLVMNGRFLYMPRDGFWRRQWQPTPVLLPGKSHGWRSLVG